jgi:hypothetical protein
MRNPSGSGKPGPGVRDRRPDRPDRVPPCRALLSVPPDRRAARRIADADHHRRRLAGARQSGVRGPAARMAQNAAQEERQRHLRDAEPSGHRDQRIAPAIIESCPTRIFLPNERAIEPQITAIYRRFGLNDRQIEILAGRRPSAIITASRGAATGCSNWASARSRSPSPPRLPKPTSFALLNLSPHTVPPASPTHGCGTEVAAWAADMLPSPHPIPPAQMGQPKE